MSEFLQKLIDNDCKINHFSSDQQIISQGLAPLISLTNSSLTIQKANLLEKAKFQNWQTKAKQLFTELYKNNVKFLIFKGFAYSFYLYNKTNIRPYSDIDIIIDQSDYDKTISVLNDLGYKCFPSRQGKYISFQNSFYDNNSPQTVIDLHWQINNRVEFHQYFTFKDYYLSSKQIKTDDIQFKTLGIIDAFILASFHYHAHRVEDRKHIWLYDLALIWNTMNNNEQLKCFTKATKTKQLSIVQSTLSLVDNTFTHCLTNNHPGSSNIVEATQDYLQPRQKKITDIKIKINNINGFFNKIKFLSEYVFQSKSYVQNRYSLNTKYFVFFYYPRMWIEDILKLFK